MAHNHPVLCYFSDMPSRLQFLFILLPLACGARTELTITEGPDAASTDAGLKDVSQRDAPHEDALDESPDATEAAIPDAFVSLPDLCSGFTGTQPEAPWPMEGRCPARPNRSASVGPRSPSVRFSTTVEGHIVRPLSIGADGTVYVPTNTGGLSALRPDGGLLWHRTFDCSVASSPLLTRNDTIVFTCEDGVIAVQLDGTPRWMYRSETPIHTSVLVDNTGNLYVGDEGGIFLSLDPEGQLRWQLQMGEPVWTAATLGHDGTIYAGSGSTLHAFRTDGTEAWTAEIGTMSGGAPSVGPGGLIYAGVYSYALWALRPDGTTEWRVDHETVITKPPVLGSDGDIYIGPIWYALYAYRSDGSLRWTRSITDQGETWPIVDSEGIIYVTDAKTADMLALTPDGDTLWTFRLPAGASCPPSMGSDGTLYLGLSRGSVLALGD